MRLNPELRTWLVCLLLIAPATIPYVAHYTATNGNVPTGFIQGDQPYYIANAREHFDKGSFTFLYGNPFSPDPETPRIYFQPHILLLGTFVYWTGWDPGTIYVIFGLLAALACARVMVALYQHLFGLTSPAHWVGLIIFFWGGGALVLAGGAITGYYWFYGGDFTVKYLFQFDPMLGWWFLNLGRNLVLPTEAYYHALFLGCILMMLKRNFVVAIGLAFLLSASHPYTGLELLLILCLWTMVETIFIRDAHVPHTLFPATSLFAILHVWYYLVYLSRFDEHRILVSQWEQAWIMTAGTMLAAYSLVGILALLRLRSRIAALEFLADWKNRLLAAWFVVAFTLANHELFMHPVQPLHFTRGYIWASLFLIGTPTLIAVFDKLLRYGKYAGRVITLALVLLFLSDNATWLGAVSSQPMRSDILMTPAQREVLHWMDSTGSATELLVSQDERIGYLATVYAPVRSRYSHPFNTPNASRRKDEIQQFFAGGTVLEEWRERNLIVLFRKESFPQDSWWQFRREYLAGWQVHDTFVNNEYAAFRSKRTD